MRTSPILDARLSRLLKYSKHFNSLPCNCSKSFRFSAQLLNQGSGKKGSGAFFATLLDKGNQESRGLLYDGAHIEDCM